MGEDVGQFVADHVLQFAFVEQVQDRPVELHGGQAAAVG